MSATVTKPAKPAEAPATPDKEHVRTLTDRICQSLLPGDVEFARPKVREAAEFLLSAAAERRPGRPIVRIDSVTDERRFMRIALINDDMPFLVNSLAAAIAEQGLSIDRLVHPIVSVQRTEDDALQSLQGKLNSDMLRESMIYIETTRVDAKARRALEKALRETLDDVRAAVKDWTRLQEVMRADADRIADEEDAELLRWLDGGMLTQLGHVTRHRDGTTHNALGICRKSAKDILADASYERAFEWFADPANRDEELLIIKANRLSKVHRRVPLDLFIVPIRDEGRRVTSLSLHAGVWTSAALNAPPRTVPRLRREVEALLEQFDFEQTGHAGKALIHAFTALPHDLLIGFERADLARIVSALMSLVDRPRPRLTLVEAPLARHLFAFVWIPRDMLSTRVRRQIEAMIEQETGATRLDWSLEVEGGNLAMIRFVLDKRESQTDVDEAAIERRLQTMLRGWSEAVENELANYFEPGRAAALSTRFARGFPAGYRMEYGPAEGARDIARLWELQPSEPEDAQRRDARLYRRGDDPSSDIRLKIYQASGNLPLSDAVPVLENFGFTVQTEIPTTLKGKQAGTIHDFLVELPEGTASGVALERAAAIELAIATVLNGDAENDPFNRLAVETGLTEDQANLLRAFYRYLRQTGMSFTIYTCVDALRCAPQVTRGLIDLFEARHDPGFSGSREDAVETARARVREGLSGVGAINDDRLLRLYLALVEAIVRTNLYTPACRQALALKIVSEQVPNLPKPLPWREIFVYSRRVEGIHLRAGPVARGGLRWSDRRDDFRTEVLGLMKAQRVKNAVIVPTGAKGGFYPKQLPNPATHRDGWAAEGQASYEVFIRALLSITDNIVDDEVVHPKGVVIHDGDDPYFVVAADKGTARFSDVANAIALEQNFWLGDAFASGGSNGYDHKAMGITARGAWISVQRHFREMGIDVQSDTITVAGCGDMSGDVFGNGMLLSKAIKLVAAFDHRHIFIDPDPDPEASWRERRRLFDAPRSSWDDYDRAVLSRGGGIFARTEKSITIGKRAAAALGIEATTLDPDALIRAVLKAPVDLMWFGGIGTYVKSSRESDALVGDPGNDAVRVDGEDMRARVVGEGANLAVTQSGRIEFALCGGRINTDFIDNSAGVDCSDNEVNIKIALAAARRAGKLAEQRRKALLEEMTEEVAAIVLEDNRDQTLALSIAELGGAGAVHSQLHVIEAFEHRGVLDRQTEGLADNDTLKRRAQDGIGLTRPELAVILSTSKLTLQDAIERSRLLKDGSLEPILIGAFPATMQDKFRTQICNHRLRGELIATKLANRVVNRLGLVHPFELAEEEGVTYDQVAAAYVVVERLFGIDAMWEEFEAADVSETARLATLDRIASALRGHMADLLRVAPALTAPSEWLEKLHSNVETLDRAAAQMLSSQAIAQSEEISSTLIELGASEEMARKTAHLFELDGIIGLAQLADETDIEICDLAAAFIRLGSELSLDWAQSTAAVMSPSDVWERLLVSGLARDFQQMRRQFLKRLSRRKGAREEIAPAVDDWLAANETAVAQFSSMIARARREGGVTAAMLAQIASMARQLLSR